MSDLSVRNVGELLRRARKAKGLSLRDAAMRAGSDVRHTTLSNWERGVTSPSVEALNRLATCYGVPNSYFFSGSSTLKAYHWRCRTSVGERDRQSFLATGERWLSAHARLEDMSHESATHSTQLDWQEVSRLRKSPRGLARFVRDTLRLAPHQPLLNLCAIIEEFGIRVLDINHEAEGIDGVSGRYGNHYAILLRSGVANDRSRMNAAHEFAHVLLGDCDREMPSSREDERRTFELASHLLFTDEMLESAFRGRSMVRLLAHKEMYGVSMSAMIVAAHRRGFLPERPYRTLLIQFSQRSWNRVEPGRVFEDRPIRFECLLENAVSRTTDLDSLGASIGLTTQEMTDRLRLRLGPERTPADKLTHPKGYVLKLHQ